MKRSFCQPISVEKRVAIALMKLGSCGEHRHFVNQLGVGKSTVCTVLQEVCRAICQAYSITFPTGDALRAELLWNMLLGN